MDLVSLFTKEKDIAGIEVADGFLRLILLGRNYEKKGQVYIREISEVPLDPGVILSGDLKDRKKFTEALKKLLAESQQKASAKISYAVVSIPHLSLYSKVFSFPKGVAPSRMNEAMKVNVSFNLPVKPEDVYIDWEEMHSPDKNELMLASAPKSLINEFQTAFAEAGITPIAIESRILSLIRILNIESAKPTLLVIKEKTYTGFVILQNDAIRFSKFNSREMAQGDIDVEIKKISNFYETEHEQIAKIVSFAEAEVPKKFANHPKIVEAGKNAGKWLPALGAAMRGLLPASEDKLISLMAVGTEEAYARQERIVFIRLMGDIVTFISILVTASFAAVWLIMLSVRTSVEAQVQLTATPITGESQEIERRVQKLNSFMSALIEIDRKAPRWSRVIEEVRSKAVPGITALSLSLPSPEGVLTLGGVARERKDISAFRNSLATSEMFIEVHNPPSNFDKRIDIPFTIMFKLKDPANLYIR